MMALAETTGASIHVASYPPTSQSGHHILAGFQRAARKGKPQYTSVFQASACVIFAHFPLTKASHMAKLSVSERALKATEQRNIDTGKGGIYGHICSLPCRIIHCTCQGGQAQNLLGFSIFQELNRKQIIVTWASQRVVKTSDVKLADDKKQVLFVLYHV